MLTNLYFIFLFIYFFFYLFIYFFFFKKKRILYIGLNRHDSMDTIHMKCHVLFFSDKKKVSADI